MISPFRTVTSPLQLMSMMPKDAVMSLVTSPNFAGPSLSETGYRAPLESVCSSLKTRRGELGTATRGEGGFFVVFACCEIFGHRSVEVFSPLRVCVPLYENSSPCARTPTALHPSDMCAASREFYFPSSSDVSVSISPFARVADNSSMTLTVLMMPLWDTLGMWIPNYVYLRICATLPSTSDMEIPVVQLSRQGYV